MDKLYGMRFNLTMDRPILTSAEAGSNAHFISPGGYEIKCQDGTIKTFDFSSTGWNIDKNNRTLMEIDVDDFDNSYVDEPKDVTPADIAGCTWQEFYIFTGEDGDPEIYPVKVSNLHFVFKTSDGTTYLKRCSNKMLAQINNDCIKPLLAEKSA